MYFLPGMDYTEFWCRYAEKTFGITVHRIQHWNTSFYLRCGIFRSAPLEVPALKIGDIEYSVRALSGIEWIAYGYKSIDSLQRRGRINKWPDGICAERKLCAPLKDWNNSAVQAYLSRNQIKIPASVDGRSRSSGIGLTPACLSWIREVWPEDYKRILEVFPLAEAQADRARWIEESASRKNKDVDPEVRVPGDEPEADWRSPVQPALD